MPKVSNTPEKLRPFINHGVVFDNDGENQVKADCPFCMREDKFIVKVETGEWRCFVCQEGTRKGGGNIYTFLRLLHAKSMKATKEADYVSFARSRKLLYPDTPRQWGLCLSTTTKQWICPGYNPEGKLTQLYRYVKSVNDNSYTWHLTTGIGHHLLGMPLFDSSRPVTYLAEGPGDGMALWEALGMTKVVKDRLTPTLQRENSLLKEANVLAVPSASVFPDGWAKLFPEKKVVLCYDNDHPKVEREVTTEPAGYQGTRRACVVLASAEPKPKEVHFLKWWQGEGNHEPSLPKGFDVRDFLSTGDCLSQKADDVLLDGAIPCPISNPKERVQLLDRLLQKVQPVPSDWLVKVHKKGVADLQPKICTTWAELEESWKKAMRWTDGLSRAFSVLLSCVVSTDLNDDQLWILCVSPASTGKTSLCDALAIAQRYVMQRDVIKGFHSGYKNDKEGSEDASLVARIHGKTLITKDGDLLLKSHNLEQILSEARALYDGNTSSSYRNNLNRDYKGHRMTWIICGTGSMAQLDSSELGARFLTCSIMDGIDEILEDDILRIVASHCERNLGQMSNCKAESRHDPHMTKAMQLTGGYVNYLRQNAGKLFEEVVIPPHYMEDLINYSKFVARLRARPSKKQEENVEREFPARLLKQLHKLASSMTVVFNLKEANEEVMTRVKRVAMDTAKGRCVDIIKFIYSQGPGGAEPSDLSASLGEPQEKTKAMLVFLRKIKVVETFSMKFHKALAGRKRWRLTEGMKDIYEKVFNISGEEGDDES